MNKLNDNLKNTIGSEAWQRPQTSRLISVNYVLGKETKAIKTNYTEMFLMVKAKCRKRT